MPFFSNIHTVAKYESKLLLRGWFFRIFAALAILFIGLINFGIVAQSKAWIIISIPSNIPYISLLFFNMFQAIIAVFLSSDFLKRDKKLDTSEVFYVRPLSNAEYVLGKTWGNMKLFLGLNLVILVETAIITLTSGAASIDFRAYLIYFFLISIPTLVYIMGLSFALMLIVKNQAITFVVLLGYICISTFYIQEKFYYLFDYMGYALPLMKSSVIGFSNLYEIYTLRFIYLFLGIGFITLTIRLYGRLPNSKQKANIWSIISGAFITAGLFCAYTHVTQFNIKSQNRLDYLALNNAYINSPEIQVDSFDIKLKQLSDQIKASVTISGHTEVKADSFVFSLNPALSLESITDANNEQLNYERKKQIVIVKLNHALENNAPVEWTFNYSGTIDQTICYLDIEKEELEKTVSMDFVNLDKQYAFIDDNYLLLTPESYWYPRSGTGYSTEGTNWMRSVFSQFKTEIEALPNLYAITQGDSISFSNNKFIYKTDEPITNLSVTIGDYQKRTTKIDNIDFSLYTFKGHDKFTSVTDSISDTIPSLIKEHKNRIEASYKLSYPFHRFSLVEVPAQFYTYPRTYSSVQDCMQPEIVFIEEMGFSQYSMNIEGVFENNKRWQQWSNQKQTDNELRVQSLHEFFWLFNNPSAKHDWNYTGRGKMDVKSNENKYYIYPQLFNFKFNFVSDDWNIVNRLIESYLLENNNNQWLRQFNGISEEEETNILFQSESLRDILSSSASPNLMRKAIKLKSQELFSLCEKAMTRKSFRDSLYTYLERNKLRNIPFTEFLDSIQQKANCDLIGYLPEWGDSIRYGEFVFPQPQTVQVRNDETDVYEHTIQIENRSPYHAWAQLTIGLSNTEPKIEILEFNPHETKECILQTESAPNRYTLNTFISKNIPLEIAHKVGRIPREKRIAKEEGQRSINSITIINENEIIIDNEDPTLFTTSETEPVGLMAQWLEQKQTSKSKYSGFSFWNAPKEWIVTTGPQYYGTTQMSAHAVKSGKGNVYAEWKAPIPEHGTYDIYYYVSKTEDINWNRHVKAEYHFSIDGSDKIEDAYLDIRRAKDGWESLGPYYIEKDTAVIRLYNDYALRAITADAVKLVKRY